MSSKRRTTGAATRRLAGAVAAVAALSLAGWPVRADVKRSKHNLSVSGPGPLRAFGERQICVFCHTPHSVRKEAPLWNRRDSGQTYIKYWSPTLDAYGWGEAPPVDGTSRLCLSCHDGTVALGDVLRIGRPAEGSKAGQGGIVMGPGADRIPPGKSRLGVDLSGSHPISFRITENLIARNNARDSPLKPLSAMKSSSNVKLDKEDKMQCTTCHDPHDASHDVTSGVPFFRSSTWDGVCTACHEL